MVKLELVLKARDLKNVAGILKGTSDPFAVVTKIATTSEEKPIVLGKTEVVKNSLNPEWAKMFTFEYQLGTPTKLAVTLFDEVSKGDNKSMGAAIFDIATVLGCRGGLQAKKVKGNGWLFAQVRKSKGSGTMTLQLQAHKLKNTEGFGLIQKSDPFFEIRRKTEDGSSWDNLVHRSNTVMNNLSPVWEEASIELSVLCGGDYDLPLQIQIYDYEKSGNHEPMGSIETTVNELFTHARSEGTSELQVQKNEKDAGSIQVTKATLSGPDFVDYIAGGCQINVVVAIDFTGSNGDPREPGTLHYFHRNNEENDDDGDGDGKVPLNDYEKAISSIVGVLSKYDNDKKYPVLGFGAKYDGVVQHAFKVGESEESEGIDGVLAAYKGVFKTGLIMSGPTVVTEVIEKAAARAESSLEEAMAEGRQTYTVLVIVTDGCVSDMTSTIQCILDVEDKPISIVIVGVGEADFSGMQRLDDLRRRGKRDIVQFVAFNEHCKNSADLTSATLGEIPDQLTTYFHSRGIQPASEIQPEEPDFEVVAEDGGQEEEEIDLSLEFFEDEIVVASGGNEVMEW